MTQPPALPTTTSKSVPVEMHRAGPGLLRRLLRHPLGGASLILLLTIALLAILAPWLAPQDPSTTNIRLIFGEPSANNLLGTDSAGRDVLSRLLVSTTYSIAGGLVVAAIASIIGVTAGLVAGYFGGWIDVVGSWATSLTMSLPAIIVLVAARSVMGPSMWWTMAIFGVFISPIYYRVVYNAVRAVRNELYVDAARTSGLSNTRIIGRHVLMAVRAPVILLTSGIIAAGIGMQAGFDFLGLGDPTTPTWGQMLNEGFYNLSRSGTLILWPSLALGLTMICLTLFGTALRDELERSDAGIKSKGSAPWIVPRDVPATLEHPAEGELKPALLQVRDIAVAYPTADGYTTVVKGGSLTVRRGETHGLIGESGSGKTQTAFAVLGLLPRGGTVMAGSILFDGKELVGLNSDDMNGLRGKRIAYVPQEPMSNLDPSFTVGSQLTDPLRIVMGMSKADARKCALELLGKVGIPNPVRTFNSYPHQLSGGMAQRVLIAGAVASRPDLLIADEPTTALDVTVQAEVLDLLRELQSELNMSILIVTHNFGVVADLCNHVSVMQNGVVVETGATKDVFRNPMHPYTRSLFEAIPKGTPRAPLAGIASPESAESVRIP